MQSLVLTMIVLISASVAITVAVVILDRRGRITRLQILLGLAIGLVGAFAVLVGQIDLVPDGLDDPLLRLFVVGVTVAAVFVTWYRIARA